MVRCGIDGSEVMRFDRPPDAAATPRRWAAPHAPCTLKPEPLTICSSISSAIEAHATALTQQQRAQDTYIYIYVYVFIYIYTIYVYVYMISHRPDAAATPCRWAAAVLPDTHTHWFLVETPTQWYQCVCVLGAPLCVFLMRPGTNVCVSWAQVGGGRLGGMVERPQVSAGFRPPLDHISLHSPLYGGVQREGLVTCSLFHFHPHPPRHRNSHTTCAIGFNGFGGRLGGMVERPQVCSEFVGRRERERESGRERAWEGGGGTERDGERERERERRFGVWGSGFIVKGSAPPPISIWTTFEG